MSHFAELGAFLLCMTVVSCGEKLYCYLGSVVTRDCATWASTPRSSPSFSMLLTTTSASCTVTQQLQSC